MISVAAYTGEGMPRFAWLITTPRALREALRVVLPARSHPRCTE